MFENPWQRNRDNYLFNPFFPASGPANRSFNGLHPKSKFLAFLWNPNAKNWGYGGIPKNKEEWIERYKTSVKKLADLRKAGIAGGIYTQTTDVEPEINGLITYDRKVQKLSPAELAKILKDSGLMD